jgi:hypothetical protein
MLIAITIVWAASAAVVDRVAVAVGKTVFTESEVMDEVRLTEFLNQEPLDLGPQQRRAAAERLVDQQLLRNEMQIEHFSEPAAAEADAMLRDLRREKFPGEAQYRDALQRYGITAQQLKQHLLWQLAVLRFTDQRFRPEIAQAPGPEVTPAADASANRASPATDGAPTTVEQLMDAWLKEARGNTRVVFKPEAFQ